MPTAELTPAHSTNRRGAPKKPGALTAQINTRIDAQLKERAEAAFASANLSSSEAIRALYQHAADLGDGLRSLDDLIPSATNDEDETARKLRLIENSSHIVENVLARFGFEYPPSMLKPLTEEEIEAAYYEDYLKE